jgi:hypothetical protein
VSKQPTPTVVLVHGAFAAAIYPLDHICDAVRHVTRPGKLGTVLVTP